MTTEVRVDETLEAVALVLRDLKTEFEENLSRVALEGGTEREGLFSRLTEIAEAVDGITARAAADRRDLEALLKETSQHLNAIVDRQREETAAQAQELRTFIETLQGETADAKATGHAAVKIARAAQESLVRLNEETKQATESLAAGLGDARARHQTAMAGLAELDAKAVVQEDVDGLRSWATTQLDPLAEKVSTLFERLEKFQELEQETQNSFQRIGAECKALASKDEEYQAKFTQALEGLASKQDLEAVQELLEETAGRAADVLDFSQKAVDQAEQALKKHQTWAETAIEALRDMFSDRQEQLRDQMTEIRKEVLGELVAEAQTLVDARGKDSDRMLVQQAEQFIAKLAENIKGERGPAGHVSRVQQWVPDYQFQELALVRHRAGLWQAIRGTSQEPCESSEDWNLVAAGIRSVAVSPDEIPGSYRLLTLDSADFVHATEFHVPLPTFYKTWDAEHEYRHYDSVMEDGHRWLAVKDAPKGPPSRSEDWVLLGMRGGRGARGAKGDPGPAGPEPDMEEILDAYDQRRLEANGTPVSSFRGSWRFGTDYVVGDFVRGPGVVALCREAHRAENPPAGTNAQWEVLFNLPDSGAERGPRPQDLQAQITALTAQVEALTGRDS